MTMPTARERSGDKGNMVDILTEPAAQSWKNGFVYFDELGKNTADKAALLLSHAPHAAAASEGAGLVIVDIGCAGGDVLAAIHAKLPRALVIGIDIKQKAITDSKMKVPKGRFHLLDIAKDKLPIRENSADLVNMSSVCHELIDSHTRVNRRTILTRTLKELRRILKPGAKLIIREPVVPESSTETIILSLSKVQRVTATRARVAEAYASLTEAELFEKFAQEWIYIDEDAIAALPSSSPNQQVRYAVPAWIVAEYARKRTFIDRIGNWQSEMREQNAAFTPHDLNACAVAAGFEPANIQIHTLMENGYYGEFKDDDGITLSDRHGAPIDQSIALPSHMYVVLVASPVAE